MQLVIVESPTKSKTLQGFLGPKFKVLSSYGHIRDLPKHEFGIDIENNFEPKYVIPMRAKKNINSLIEEAKKSDTVILATDEDREGEAIAWHLAFVLKLKEKNYQRIVFHEITKTAIDEALKNPRKIDINMVDAQQARRVLDRIVGYKLSPFLWKKIARGLSAGRVQSVAVKLVVEREREIEDFKAQEYWTVSAKLRKFPIDNSQLSIDEFEAALIKKGDKTLDKLAVKNEQGAKKILEDLENAEYKVENIEKKELKRNPLPPFTTSTLQQEAWQKLHWPAKMTMAISQQLYETGKITYHRTDSLNLSELSLSAAKNFIIENYGKEYWPGFSRKYKSKGRVQEAHEAIRPSSPENTPEKISQKLDKNQLKLYELIWKRFISCQMSEAIFDSTAIDITAQNYTFRTTGQINKFDGFLKIYPLKFTETELPNLKIDDLLKLIELNHTQHFTQPPARYTEATLIKILEENGIGRPSTYAPILSTIQARNYIEKDDQRKFRPTEIGTVVNDLLVQHFPKVVDMQFTAEMEEDLDEIAEGKEKWAPIIKKFYTPFAENLEQKNQEVSKKDVAETKTEKKCPKCDSPLLIKLGRFGKFYACSGFPKCKYTESLKDNNLGIKCPKCKKGQIVEKRTKKKKIFYGCSNWPECDFALWDKPIDKTCPKCDEILIETKRKEIKCSNKDCDFRVEK